MNSSQRWWWPLYWLFLSVSFCVIGFWLVTMATGYRYNPHTHWLQKTGMIVVSDAPEDSALILDGQNYPLHRQTRIPNILPGTYHMTVTKPSYANWEDTITVQPGFAIPIGPINLFLAKPARVLDTSKYPALLPYYTVHDDRLRIIDGELWFNATLISRFSEPPTNTVLMPTGRQIVYLQDNQVRIIDITGKHDQLLYTRKINDPEPLALIDGVLVFNDLDGLTAIQIQ